MTAALKYLNARVLLKLTFSSENEAKNPAIAVQYLEQIEKKIENDTNEGHELFSFKKYY